MPFEEASVCAQLPEEVMFTITKPPVQNSAARLGVLNLPNRKQIQTPHYFALGSRGAVPHLTQDNVVKHTDIRGVYMALEDFIEKPPPQGPSILRYTPPDSSSRLRRFTACPDDQILVLGARRTPPVQSPGASTNTALAVMTSVGFRKLQAQEFRSLTTAFNPDIIVGLGDVPFGYYKVSYKKIDKITDRTAKWMQEHIKSRVAEAKDQDQPQPLLYAPLLPLPVESQRYYMDSLVDDMLNNIQGLAIYSTTTLENLPSALEGLPRLGLTEPGSPLELLHNIQHGIDIATLPFLTRVTDGGTALDFTFPVSGPVPEEPKPLGISMWDTKHATDVSPLKEGCKCYACTNHHRAFVRHLLSVKEMLAWVLLQLHNHHIMDEFFAGVRESIARGTFAEDVADFERVYESELPEAAGLGPRLRGYQYKSKGPNEKKRNIAPFKPYDATQKVAEAEATSLPGPDVDAKTLEDAGFAEKTG